MRLAFVAAAGFLFFGTSAAARADQDLDTERLNREAKALFVVVTKDVGIPTRSCELDSAWSPQPVPFMIAHRFLGLQAFADLQSPPSVAPPIDIIGGVPNDAWCSEEEWTKYEDGHAVAQAAALRALPKGADPTPLWWRREAFGYPIFNQAYDRAVVVQDGSRWPAYVVDNKGTVMRSPPEGGGTAYIYERKAGVWSKIGEEQLFTVD